MSASCRITVELTRPGKGVWVFDETVALDEPDLKVLYTEYTRASDLTDDGERFLEPGSPMIWFIFPGKWYEVGSFYAAAGTLNGWYTNICTPFEIDGDRWCTTDLFLDFWQPATGLARFLDEDELAEGVRAGLLSDPQQRRVEMTRLEIEEGMRTHNWPPPPVRSMDLQQVQSLLQ